jgi:hypothetical protein
MARARGDRNKTRVDNQAASSRVRSACTRKVVQIGGVTFKRYSMKALDELQKAFKTVDMDKIWSLNKPTASLRRPTLPRLRKRRDFMPGSRPFAR